MNNRQKSIERRLRRLNGMSPEAQEAMHKAAAREQWRARCRNCGNWSQATAAELMKMDCAHCGLPLGHRV